MKIAPEGYPFVGVCGVLCAAAAALAAWVSGAAGLCWALTLLFAALTGFMLYFFRDPERRVPQGAGPFFVSPADGRILAIRDVVEEKHCLALRKEISIFMSPFNVHVNRAPCDGAVAVVQHNPGRYRAAYRDEASRSNENTEIVLDTDFGKLLLRQVAGFLARRTVCRVAPGAQLAQGDRFGIIKFGSRVDIYLPPDCRPEVLPKQRVTAGETVLARMPTPAGAASRNPTGAPA